MLSPEAASARPAAVGAATAAAPTQPSGVCPDNMLFLHCPAFGAGFCAATDCKLIHDAYRAEEERASWLAESLPNVAGWGQMEAAIARPGSGGVLPGPAPGVPPVLLIAGGRIYFASLAAAQWSPWRSFRMMRHYVRKCNDI